MASYKVIQDIEAEDKLVGPLSLRQFIYAAIAAICAYLSFIVATKGVPFLLVIFLPPMVFTGFFAFPWGRDQPTEVWALAKIRFYLKSRRRIWDQSGVKDLVTITAPKKIEKTYTNGLTQNEVHSRLTALATTLDSRGWAVKNVNTNLYAAPASNTYAPSDRLVDVSNIPQAVPTVDVTAADDILDETNNPRAAQLQQMMSAATVSHRQQLMQQLQQPAATPAQAKSMQLPPPADYWFLNKPVDMPQPSGNNTVFTDAKVVLAGDTTDSISAAEPTPAEEELGEELKEKRAQAQKALSNQHLKTIQPLGVQPNPIQQPPAQPVTPASNTATIGMLARNNDLNVATLARVANKEDERHDEVVVSLHNHAS